MSVIIVPLIVAMTGLMVALLERSSRLLQRRLEQHDLDFAALRSDIGGIRSEIHGVERKLTSEIRDVERQLQSDIRDAERHLTIRIDGLYGHPGVAQA